MSDDYRASERVARGVALLDAKMPGWREKIDIDALDLMSNTLCIVGQIGSGYTGGYVRVVGELGLNLDFDGPEKHGFLAYRDTGSRMIEEYAALSRVWRDVLTQ